MASAGVARGERSEPSICLLPAACWWSWRWLWWICCSWWIWCGEWRVNGSREASGASRASACCLLPAGGPGGGYGDGSDGQEKPNFMLYNMLLTVIVLIIVIDIILLRQIFVYVLDIYYLCSDFKTI